MTFSIITLSKIILSISKHRIMTLAIMTLGIRGFGITIEKMRKLT